MPDPLPPNPEWGLQPPAIERDLAWHLGPDYSQLREAAQRVRDAVGDDPQPRIRIGILDTGYAPDHSTKPPHLDETPGARDFYNRRRDTGSAPDLEHGHGTATTALLASELVGGAPDAEVIHYRVANHVVQFYVDSLADGIIQATDDGCRVVSISLGNVRPTPKWARAVNHAYDHGVTVVAAGGNMFPFAGVELSELTFPARFGRVIAVTGVADDHLPYDWAFRDIGGGPGIMQSGMQGCWGPPEVMHTAMAAYTPNIAWAVAEDADTLDLDGAGTSAATPQVAAAAALWLQLHAPIRDDLEPWRDVEAVRHALFASAESAVLERWPGHADPHAIHPVKDWDDAKRARKNFEYFGNGALRASDALDIDYATASAAATPTLQDEVSFFDRIVTLAWSLVRCFPVFWR